MIKLYRAKITDFTQADYTKMYGLLDCVLKEKIQQKKYEFNKKQSLAGYILLFRGVKQLYGKTEFHIKFNENGKPLCDFCFFSISHNGEHVVCAFSDSPIGVDIQHIYAIKPRKKYKFFNQKENCYVNQNKELLSKRYIEIFTKKEAALKMLGLSLADAASIDVFSNEFCFKSVEKDNFILTFCSKSEQFM